MYPELVIEFNNDIFYIMLLCSLLLIAVLKSHYWKYTKMLLLGVATQRYANQFLRQENVFTQRVEILTFLLMLINFTIVISKISIVNSFYPIFIILICVMAYYILKYFAFLLLGRIFIVKDIIKVGLFFSLLFDRVLSIIIFPLIVCLCFFAFNVTSIVLDLLLIFFTIMMVFKIFWTLNIGQKIFGVSRFYIFLYLCVLEIFPIVLLAKGIFY
tara:strand:- start:710 stop:1351 length:642 start_codon:yes stop_codon:yes gene_type:complete